MPAITINSPQPTVKKMQELGYGEIAIIVDKLYNGTLVWRVNKDSFTALMNNRGQCMDSFRGDNSLLVRVLQAGDEVTLKF